MYVCMWYVVYIYTYSSTVEHIIAFIIPVVTSNPLGFGKFLSTDGLLDFRRQQRSANNGMHFSIFTVRVTPYAQYETLF